MLAAITTAILLGMAAAADIPEVPALSCHLHVFMINNHKTGFGESRVYIYADGVLVDDTFATGLTLPIHVKASGHPLYVEPGQKITASYVHEKAKWKGNTLLFTGANGEELGRLNDLSSSMNFTVTDAVSCDCSYRTSSLECDAISVRNEWRSLSYCEKVNFINAMNDLRTAKDSTGGPIFDNFVVLHYIGTLPLIAAKNLLLPWHRSMIHHFERQLRDLGGNYTCITLPYWDWTLDFGNESNVDLYPDFGGFKGYPACLDYPFGTWTDPVTEGCVIRGYSPYNMTFRPAFATQAAVQLGTTISQNYTFLFRYMVRNPHKGPHFYLAGDMRGFYSPSDPLFWLHHANIDRNWQMWQDCWDFEKPIHFLNQYEHVANTSMYDMMPIVYPGMTNSTIISTFDTYKMGYTYNPMYDDMPQLNTGHPVYEQNMCKWDWLKQENFDDNNLPYRYPVHTPYQRERTSSIRIAYQTELASSGNYYAALLAQLKTECIQGEWDQHDAMIAEIWDPLASLPWLFRNLCDLYFNGTWEMLYYA
jgi:tyrosinase